jgi:hypothetical protein
VIQEEEVEEMEGSGAEEQSDRGRMGTNIAVDLQSNPRPKEVEDIGTLHLLVEVTGESRALLLEMMITLWIS